MAKREIAKITKILSNVCFYGDGGRFDERSSEGVVVKSLYNEEKREPRDLFMGGGGRVYRNTLHTRRNANTLKGVLL